MDDTLEDFVMRRAPNAERPLLGTTVLVVEDSRYACEAIRLLCLRSGARIRRADSLRAASRHLRAYRPTVAIIDLGLPDGSGLSLIRDLARGSPRIPVIIAMSGEAYGLDKAREAGADAVMAKPVTSLGHFQETILSHLPQSARPAGPRAVPNETLAPDPIAMKDDLVHAVRILDRRADGETLHYVAQFLGGVAISAHDRALLTAARGLDASAQGRDRDTAALGRLNAVIRARLDSAAPV